MEEKKLKRIVVDFYAVRSVTIAAYDEEEAIQKATEYLDHKDPNTSWEYDEQCTLDEVCDGAINEDCVRKCAKCGTEILTDWSADDSQVCPHCGYENNFLFDEF